VLVADRLYGVDWSWGRKQGFFGGDGEVDGKGVEEEAKRWAQRGRAWAIDRRPPRDRCGYKSSVWGVYGADGGLGHDKRGITSTNLDDYENEIEYARKILKFEKEKGKSQENV